MMEPNDATGVTEQDECRASPDRGSLLPTYSMTKHPRGKAIIFNNEKFSKTFSQRLGTEEDAARLQSTFETLGFLVERYDNQSNSEMMQKLMKEALSKDHAEYDCFVCCILSHGERDCVYGSNGSKVKIKDLMENLQAIRCPLLAGKPKLFFVQACQGEERARVTNLQRDAPEGKLEVVIYIPNEADFLLGHSTTLGYEAYRSENGSLYIQKLCDVLMQFSESTDIEPVLKEVSRQVSELNIGKSDDPVVQMPHFVSHLRKSLYLCRPPSSNLTDC